MSFLDNLENNLKALESNTSGEDAAAEQRRREADRAREAAIAPWAERLKTSEFSSRLLSAAAREGFRLRRKVRITWLGSNLRLETGDAQLELRPAADGVDAVSSRGGVVERTEKLDLTDSPEGLLSDWLAGNF